MQRPPAPSSSLKSRGGASTTSSQPTVRKTAAAATSASTTVPRAASARATPAAATSSASFAGRPAVARSASGASSAARSSVVAPRSHHDSFPTDPLSRTTTPLLYLIFAHLPVSEVCVLGRANRLLFGVTAGASHPVVWKARFLCLARAPVPLRKKGDPNSTMVTGKPFLDEKGLTVVGNAYYQRMIDATCRLPPSLPRPSPYRHAVLSALREQRSAKFASYISQRSRNVQNECVWKPVVEHLGLQFQLNLVVAPPSLGSHSAGVKTQLWRRDVATHVHDNTVVCTWRGQVGLTIKQLQGVQLMGFSGAVMTAMELSDVEATATREWACLRSGENEHTLSLLEWRVKGRGSAHSDESANVSNSPFEPNRAARARQAAAAAASSAAASAVAARTSRVATLPIHGMEIQVLAGVWGPVSRSGPSSHEVAFIWISLPHTMLCARLPPPIRCQELRWTPTPDDLDSRMGLHGFALNFSLRSMSATICTWFFTEISAELEGSSVRLKLPSVAQLIPSWSKLPGLPWRTDMWSGRFERICVLDLVVRCEKRVLWIVSVPVTLQPLAEQGGANLHMDELHADAQRFGGAHQEEGVGQVSFELAHTPSIAKSSDGRRASSVTDGSGATSVASLVVRLNVSLIDAYFGTSYASTGCASAAHALQVRARSDMTHQEQAAFQAQQLALRDEERPLHTRAARGHHAPDFTVVAPAPPAGSGSASASRAPRGRSSSSSASASRVPRRAAQQAEWVDVTPVRDEDEGFRF